MYVHIFMRNKYITIKTYPANFFHLNYKQYQQPIIFIISIFK